MTRRYPTDAQARDTFTDTEFAEAVDAKLAGETVVIVTLHQSKLRDGLTSALVHSFAELSECIPGSVMDTDYDGLRIRRNITRTEAESMVLDARKSEMWYTEDSPYYVKREDRD